MSLERLDSFSLNPPTGQQIFHAKRIYSAPGTAKFTLICPHELVDAGWLLRYTQAAGWQQRGCLWYRVNPWIGNVVYAQK